MGWGAFGRVCVTRSVPKRFKRAVDRKGALRLAGEISHRQKRKKKKKKKTETYGATGGIKGRGKHKQKPPPPGGGFPRGKKKKPHLRALKAVCIEDGTVTCSDDARQVKWRLPVSCL